MNLPAFEQACLESRRLTALSECLQDLMEDRRADPGKGHAGAADPERDRMLDLIAGIHGAGGRIVELVDDQMAQMAAKAAVPVLEEHIALATQEMLTAVVEVSHACDQLRHSPIIQKYPLPDFALLARQSADLNQRVQRARPAPGPASLKNS